MAVSVRMTAALEQAIEEAARQRGITKSQLIIEAVEQALGQRSSSYQLMLKAQRAFGVEGGAPVPMQVREDDPAWGSPDLGGQWRGDLKARHEAEMADWLAFQAAKKRGETWSPEGDHGAR
jgi:hypothetical protein